MCSVPDISNSHSKALLNARLISREDEPLQETDLLGVLTTVHTKAEIPELPVAS